MLVTGGCDATESALKSGELKEMLKEKHDFEYDLVVVGGGSGGLAASKVSDGPSPLGFDCHARLMRK